MYLKQIEISGFKSFAVPTVISFEAAQKKSRHTSSGHTKPGITAIVGPNGSGKSNVSDAMRWVMGEQSMKNLRGKKSEDIIFAGSDKKGKLSMAHVALVFDNADKKIPVDYDEVTIERKMYRNGESEFLINGARVRLLDVIDTLAHAGMGKGSYCVVGQGMTDAILGATPIERRYMIEEAAGVKHFQIKKIRSEKKLDKTRENLQRTRQLIAEIEPHLKTLKRQAEKAARSKDVYEELKTAQRGYYAHLWHEFESERTAIDAQALHVKGQKEEAEADLARVAELSSQEAKKIDKGDDSQAFERSKNKLYTDLREIDQRIAQSRGRIEILTERKAAETAEKSVPVDLSYVRGRLESIQSNHKLLEAEIEKVTTLEQVGALQKVAQSVSSDLQKLHDDAGKSRVTLPVNVNKQKIEELEESIAQTHKSIEEDQKRQSQIQEEILQINQKISDGLTSDKQARKAFFELEKQHRAKQSVVDEIRQKENHIKIALARIEVREEDLSTEALHELGTPIQELTHAQESVSLAVREAHVSRLKSEYERIGGIDPLVVEEYEETQERFDFLTNESADLEKALESAREVIKEMDKKIHSAFVQAYKSINEEFTKYFRILFDGGNAKLSQIHIDTSPRNKLKADEQTQEETGILSDQSSHEMEDDTDEAQKKSAKTEIGIEIAAMPPGKKVKNMALLSGGERSLTSIAMLFAIISYNPPPFAVLDEVEAALDEANSRRLAKIFADLSDKTQFVIITHNRETMRHADMLYGVTMQGDGASQILSLKLDQLKESSS